MTTRQNECVASVAHADHTFAAIVLGVVVYRRLFNENYDKFMQISFKMYNIKAYLIQILVLDSVDFLQQVAQSIDEHFLLERTKHMCPVQMLIDYTNGCVRLTGF